jgi:hypothetical protein
VNPTVSPEEILRRTRIIMRKFEGRAGPMAASSHWHEVSNTSRTESGRRDPYVEPPVGWREAAAKRYPDAADWGNPHLWESIAWRDVSISIRPDILKLSYP